MESTAQNTRNPNRVLSSIVKPPPQIGININHMQAIPKGRNRMVYRVLLLVLDTKPRRMNHPPNFTNRTIYHTDNLPVLKGMNSGSVHLIATDPPFNKNRDFHATPESLARGAKFQDRWNWDRDVHEDWMDEMHEVWPRSLGA